MKRKSVQRQFPDSHFEQCQFHQRHNKWGNPFGHRIALGQLTSTKSYQQKDLSGTQISGVDLSGVDLSGFDLSGALMGANVTNANFTGATILGTAFSTNNGFTFGQLASTLSYGEKHLAGLQLTSFIINGWDFSGQDLSNAILSASNISNSSFANANLSNTTIKHIGITGAKFSAINFSGTNLEGVIFSTTSTTLTTSDFSDADVRGVTGWSIVSNSTEHDTILPDGSIQGIGDDAR